MNTSRKRLRRDADIRSAAAARRRRRPETSLFVGSHLPSKVALPSMSSHEICLSARRDSVWRRSRLDVLNSLWDFSIFLVDGIVIYFFNSDFIFFDDTSEFSGCFFLCCFYYLLKVHVNFYISTFFLSKLYSTFVHTFSSSEIYNGQPEFPCALFL